MRDYIRLSRDRNKSWNRVDQFELRIDRTSASSRSTDLAGKGLNVFGNLGQFADLMKTAAKAREMVEKATESIGHLRAEGSSGGGSVVAVASGKLELVSIRLDPKLLDEPDQELLEELIVSAVNQALTKAREASSEAISSAIGDLPLPPGLMGALGGRS